MSTREFWHVSGLQKHHQRLFGQILAINVGSVHFSLCDVLTMLCSWFWFGSGPKNTWLLFGKWSYSGMNHLRSPEIWLEMSPLPVLSISAFVPRATPEISSGVTLTKCWNSGLNCDPWLFNSTTIPITSRCDSQVTASMLMWHDKMTK